jgi:hypothetical protein
MLQGGCRTGLAKVTSAYDLPARCNISCNMFIHQDRVLISVGFITVIEFGPAPMAGFKVSNFLFIFWQLR